MADHSIAVKINDSAIKRFNTQLRELKLEIKKFSTAVDSLSRNLEKNVTQIREMLKTVPKVRYANVSSSGGGRSGSGGSRKGKAGVDTSVSDSIADMLGMDTPARRAADKAAKARSNKQSQLDDIFKAPKGPPTPQDLDNSARSQFLRGNATGAAGDLLKKMATFGNPIAKGLANMAITLGPQVALFKAIAGPVAAVIAGFTAVGYAAVKLVNGLQEQLQSVNNLRAITQGGVNRGSAEGLGAALGIDSKEVASDATNFTGGPQAFYELINQLRKLYKENPLAANKFAKEMGLDKYTGVGELSNEQYAKTKRGNPDNPFEKNPVTDYASEQFSELGADLKEVLDAIKGVVAGFVALNPIFFVFKEMVHQTAQSLRGLQFIFKKIAEFFGGKDGATEKLDKAADKLDSAADKWIKAAGTYGGGSRTKTALQGAFIDPSGQNWQASAAAIRRLGEL